MGRKKKSFDGQTIDGMANELTHDTVKSMCKDGKLTPQGRSLAKLMDRIMPDEKVDEWGWNLSRKERAEIKRRAAENKAAEEKKKAEACARAAYRRKQRQGARYRLQRFPPTSRNRRGRNGRKSCARSSAASRGRFRSRRPRM